jgi:hypothetical protein
MDRLAHYQHVPPQPQPQPLSFPPVFFPAGAASFFLPSPFQQAATIFSTSSCV